MRPRLLALALCLVPLAASATDELVPIERKPRRINNPGNTPCHVIDADMLLAVSAGNVSLESPAGTESVNMKPTGFQWRQQAQTVKLVNTGKFVFHGVDIRLK